MLGDWRANFNSSVEGRSSHAGALFKCKQHLTTKPGAVCPFSRGPLLNPKIRNASRVIRRATDANANSPMLRYDGWRCTLGKAAGGLISCQPRRRGTAHHYVMWKMGQRTSFFGLRRHIGGRALGHFYCLVLGSFDVVRYVVLEDFL